MRYTNKYTPLGVRQKMIMHLLWDSEGEMTKNEVAEGLKCRYDVPLSQTATVSMLNTLITRGYVKKGGKRGGNYLYSPTITKKEFLVRELKWVQEMDFEGSAVAFWDAVLEASVDSEDLPEALSRFEP